MKVCYILIILPLLALAQPKPLGNTGKSSKAPASQAFNKGDGDVRGVEDPHKLVDGDCFFEDVPGNDELEQITVRIYKPSIPAGIYEDDIMDALDEQCGRVPGPPDPPRHFGDDRDNRPPLKPKKAFGNLKAAAYKPNFEYQPLASTTLWSIYIGKILRIWEGGKEGEARKCVPKAVSVASSGKIIMGDCKWQAPAWI